MGGKSRRSMVVQMAVESTVGVDPGAGYVDILTNTGSDISPQAGTQERDTVRATFTPQGQVIGAKSWQLTLPVELKGGGDNAGTIVAPELDVAFRACALQREDGLVIAVDNVSGTPTIGGTVTNTAQGSATVGTLYDYVAGAGSTGTLYIRDHQANTPADSEALAVTGGFTADTVGTPSDALVYRPQSDRELMESASVRFNWHGHRHIATGTRGTFTFQGQAGGFGVASFTMTGAYNEPTEVVLPASTYSTVVPARFVSAGLQIGAWDMSTTATNAVSFDVGNTINPRPDVNTAEGIIGYEITGRRPVGSLDPEVADLSDYNPWSIWTAGAKEKIYMTIGSVVGERIRLLVPKAQYDQMAYADRNDVNTYNLPYTCTVGEDGAGDNEVYITMF